MIGFLLVLLGPVIGAVAGVFLLLPFSLGFGTGVDLKAGACRGSRQGWWAERRRSEPGNKVSFHWSASAAGLCTTCHLRG